MFAGHWYLLSWYLKCVHVQLRKGKAPRLKSALLMCCMEMEQGGTEGQHTSRAAGEADVPTRSKLDQLDQCSSHVIVPQSAFSAQCGSWGDNASRRDHPMPFNPSLPTDSRRQMVLPERERREMEDSRHNEAAHQAVPLKASLRQLLNKPVSKPQRVQSKKREHSFFVCFGF